MSASISSDFSTFTANLQKALVASSRTASSIPSSRDVKYQRTLNRQLGKKLDAQADRTLRLTARLLSHSAQLLEGSSTSSKKGKSKQVEEEEDLTDGIQRNVVAITDGLLEKIDADLDLLRRGITGKKAAASLSSSAAAAEEEAVPLAAASSSSFPSTSRLPLEILNATNLPKPQLLFLDKPNTSRDAVFLPLIKEKPHGITPQVSHEPEVFYDYFYTNAEGTAGGERTRIPNPYAQEIDKAIIDNPLPDFELQGGAAEADEVEGQVMQDGMDKKPFSYVDTLHGMKECLDKLKKEKVIAVDLEHHDYRSFRGFTSLIQISTVHEDFVIDPLVPEIRANAHILNEVFASPSIVKVLHGGEMDIIWLQRDFGIYVVNLFDTYHASRRIGRKTGHSLASLLTEYTSFHPDKRLQLADWRIRPLPAEMLNYARSDTHFLLFIYKKLLQDPVMEEHAIADIRRSSATTAKQVYEHLAYDKEGGRGHGGWRPLIEKNGKAVIWGIDLPLEGRRMGGNSTSLSSFEAKALLSFEIFKAVHEWRDRLARQYDESWRYILSNKTLAGIADLAPKDTQQLMQVLGHDHKGILRDHFQELDSLLDTTRKNVEKMISNANASAQKPGSPTQSQAALSPSTCAPFSLPASSASTSNSILFGVPQKRSSPSRRSPKPSKSLLPFLFPQNGLDKVKSNFEQIAEKVHASFGQLDAFKPVEKQASRSPTPSRSPSPVGDVEMNGTESGPHTFAANGDHIFLSKKDRILANAAKSAKVEEPEEDADIVQVGKHKKNKKRKQGDAPAPASSASKVKLEVEPFDYSTVKSVLDMKPEGGASAGPSRKKQKKDKDGVNDNKKKQTGLDYDFKSAPKSMNQPKSGNRSQTFTK